MSPDFDCDPNAGSVIYTANSLDAFTISVDPQGNYKWSQKISSAGSESAMAVFADDHNNVYTGGGFEQTIDFDPGAGIANITSAGQGDAFVQKLGPVNSVGVIALNAQTISIYLNPVSNLLTIESNGLNLKDCMISLYDVTGREIKISPEVDVDKVIISLSELQEGIYMVNISTGRRDDFLHSIIARVR